MLGQMEFSDLKIAVDPEFDPRVTIEQSREYVEKGLSIMGEDYRKMVQAAYQERWIDFAQNAGKSTGGFCASPYGKNLSCCPGMTAWQMCSPLPTSWGTQGTLHPATAASPFLTQVYPLTLWKRPLP